MYTREEMGRKLLYDIGTNRLKEAFELVSQGAWLTVEESSGRVALHVAAALGQSDMITAILDRGVNIDRKDSEGYTALMRAAENGHAGAVEKLLAAGADIGARNHAGLSALDIAKAENHFLVASLLGDAQAEKRARIEEEWKVITLDVDHAIAVTKPLRFKPKASFFRL